MICNEIIINPGRTERRNIQKLSTRLLCFHMEDGGDQKDQAEKAGLTRIQEGIKKDIVQAQRLVRHQFKVTKSHKGSQQIKGQRG